MTQEEKIKRAQFQCEVMNKIIPKIEKHYINYCKALKEIWKNKIDKEKDFAILEKFGLGSYEKNYNWRYNFGVYRFKFYWNDEIKELNKIYKNILKV